MNTSSSGAASAAAAQANIPPMFRGASLGGTPTTDIDTPVTAVFLALFVLSAVFNMAIFRMNLRRGKRFLFSALLFGFSMARIVACSMRISWASHPTNVDIAIAASVFVNAGVVLLFVINLVFAKRIVRGYLHQRHPDQIAAEDAANAKQADDSTNGSEAKKNKPKKTPLDLAFTFLIASLVLVLIMMIIVLVYSTLEYASMSTSALRATRDIQRFAVVYMAALAFLPLPVIGAAYLLRPAHLRHRVLKFGGGKWRTKLALVLGTSTLLSFGAWFRAGVMLSPSRLASNPAWYHHKACFYVVYFGIEVICVYAYSLMRFDRRFHIDVVEAKNGDEENAREKTSEEDRAPLERRPSLLERAINDESQIFGSGPDDENEVDEDKRRKSSSRS